MTQDFSTQITYQHEKGKTFSNSRTWAFLPTPKLMLRVHEQGNGIRGKPSGEDQVFQEQLPWVGWGCLAEAADQGHLPSGWPFHLPAVTQHSSLRHTAPRHHWEADSSPRQTTQPACTSLQKCEKHISFLDELPNLWLFIIAAQKGLRR